MTPGTIDLHIYKETKFVELNGRGYYHLPHSEKVSNAVTSAAVHRVRGLEWTPTKPGKYVIARARSRLTSQAAEVHKRIKKRV